MKTHLHYPALARKLTVYLLCMLYTGSLMATNVSGNQSGTWTKANSPYIITGDITVPAGQKLIIQPGVEVRSQHYYDKFTVNGVLYAVGTAVDSIRFNGFADATTPASNNGGFLYINSSNTTDSTVLQYVAMNKWGDKDYYTGDQAAVELNAGIFVMRNSTISNSDLQGIWGYGDLTKVPVIDNVTFINNPVPVRLYTDNVGGITNCTNAVINLQGGYFTRASTIPKPGTGSYYVFDKGTTHEFNNAKLTIQAGVEIRSMNYADKLTVSGTGVLKAIGTAADSIRFKGFADATTPASTHGGFIYINSSIATDSSVMQYISMDKMGDKDYYTGDQAAIELGSGAFVIRNSRIANSEKQGIWGYGDLAVVPVIANVTFTGNPEPVRLYTDNLGKISGNSGAVIYVQGGYYTRASTIAKPGTGTTNYYVLDKGTTHEFNNAKLTIQAGVEIRSMNYADKLTVSGTGVIKAIGTSTDSIRFKGFADATTPNSTHGGFIYVNSSNAADSTVFQYISMDKWGDKDYYTGDQTAIELGQGIFVLRNSRISNSEKQGIWGYGDLAVDPVIANVTFVNNPIPVRLYTDNVGKLSGNTGAVVNLQGGYYTKVSTISRPGLTNTSYYIFDKGTSHEFANANLTIQPGVEIRSMNYADRLTISGTGVIKAIGTETDSIWFKGYADPATSASSTHAGYIYLNSTSTTDSCVFAYTTIDRWGDKDYYTGDQAALEIGQGKVRVTNSTISNSENRGIFGYGDASGLTVYKSYIVNNKYGAYFNQGKPSLTRSNIYNNATYGIYNASGTTLDTVEARTNWWGDSTGPKQTSTNPNGKGNAVSSKVRYKTWLLYPYQANDLGVTSVSAPVSGCALGDSQAIKINIKNYGSKTQTGFNVTYSINNGAAVTENVGTLSIASDSVRSYTFKSKFFTGTPLATYSIKVYTALAGDTLKFNDTASASVVNRKPYVGKDSSLSVCAGSAVNISKLYNTAGYTSFGWSTNRPDSVTEGTYSLTVVNSYGCADTAVVTITGAPKPALGKDTTVKVCPGYTTGIRKLYDTTGYASVIWGAAKPDSAKAGSYNVIVTNSFGCTDTAVVTVANNPKPALGKDTTVKICTGGFTNITGLYTTTGLTVKYSTLRPDSVGKGNYTLYVTNTSGCMDTAIIKVDTLPSPAKPGVIKTGSVSFCVGDSLILTTSATGTLQWYRNNTAIKKATTSRYAVKLGGNYKLQVSSAGSCAVFSDSVVATATSVAQPTITLLNDSLVSSSASGNQWFENYTSLPGVTAQKYSPDNIDVYTVQVTSGACKSPMSAPFYYTANTLMNKRNKSAAAVSAESSRIGTIGEVKATLYPNPAVSEASLFVSGKQGRLGITVSDMTGKKVLTIAGQYNSKIAIPVQNLAAGIYMVTITDGKTTKVVKLLKQ